jgi:SMI1 / KNR4 family (SUKH-1)
LSIVDLLPTGAWSPAAPDADDAIAALEQRVGHRLPADLRELHRRCRDVSLFERRYEFLRPEAMGSIGQLQCGDDTDDCAPRTWLGVIDMHDGNYVAVDLVPNADGSNSWLDCDHEAVGEAAVIAASLEQLVQRALACPQGLYWLERGCEPYRTLKYENPPSYWRRVDGGWYASLGDEVGPEKCADAGCPRRHIVHSVMCRAHHYEMVRHRPCPFEDGDA